METRIDLKRVKDHLHEDGTPDICRQRLVPADAFKQATRAIRVSARKSWNPHFFNTRANLNYVGQIPDVRLYGVDEMSASEREDFLAWYDREKHREFDNTRVLKDYCQDDCTVLREACTIFCRDFIEIGNIEVFLEAYTIASAWNKVLRKKFLKPHTIGLIPAGGYSCNQN